MAGAVFAEVGLSLFVTGAAFGDILGDRRNVWLGPGDAGGKTRKRENAKTKHENAKTGKRENAQIEHVPRSTWNTNVITALGMCKVCTEAVHSVAL